MTTFIADVYDLYIQSNDTNKVIGSTTLSSANLNFTVNENEIRAGRGNSLLGLLHSARDLTVEAEDVSFNWDFIQMQLAKQATSGSVEAYATPKWYEATGTTPTIALEATPSDPASVSIFDEDGAEISTFTVNNNIVTFTSGAVSGKHYEVRGYKYNAPAGTETVVIDASTFAKGVTLVLETIEIDHNEIPVNKVQIVVPNALPNGTFSLNTTSERQANAMSVTFRAVKGRFEDTLGKIHRIPIS